MKIKRNKKADYTPIIIDPYDKSYNGRYVSRDSKGIVVTKDDYIPREIEEDESEDYGRDDE